MHESNLVTRKSNTTLTVETLFSRSSPKRYLDTVFPLFLPHSQRQKTRWFASRGFRSSVIFRRAITTRVVKSDELGRGEGERTRESTRIERGNDTGPRGRTGEQEEEGESGRKKCLSVSRECEREKGSWVEKPNQTKPNRTNERTKARRGATWSGAAAVIIDLGTSLHFASGRARLRDPYKCPTDDVRRRERGTARPASQPADQPAGYIDCLRLDRTVHCRAVTRISDSTARSVHRISTLREIPHKFLAGWTLFPNRAHTRTHTRPPIVSTGLL